jgi:hypothetical protein
VSFVDETAPPGHASPRRRGRAGRRVHRVVDAPSTIAGSTVTSKRSAARMCCAAGEDVRLADFEGHLPRGLRPRLSRRPHRPDRRSRRNRPRLLALNRAVRGAPQRRGRCNGREEDHGMPSRQDVAEMAVASSELVDERDRASRQPRSQDHSRDWRTAKSTASLRKYVSSDCGLRSCTAGSCTPDSTLIIEARKTQTTHQPFRDRRHNL